MTATPQATTRPHLAAYSESPDGDRIATVLLWLDAPTERAVTTWPEMAVSRVAGRPVLIDSSWLGLHPTVADQFDGAMGRIVQGDDSTLRATNPTKAFFRHPCLVTGTDTAWREAADEISSPLVDAISHMLDNAAEPRQLESGTWHLPFVTEEERSDVDSEDLPRVALVRCLAPAESCNTGADDPDKCLAIYRIMTADSTVEFPTSSHVLTPCDTTSGDDELPGWTRFRDASSGGAHLKAAPHT